MSNINGKVYALNAITPMKPWKTPLLRLFFWFLGTFPSQGVALANLSFIHFARWVIIPRHRWPQPADSSEKLKYDYLLFFSNFNGTWNQYIDAFSAVLSDGLNHIWRWSEKFPGATPVTGFKQYIDRVQFETDYYYTAYPEATINDVKAARLVQNALDAVRPQVEACSPEQFADLYLNFVVAVQANLGDTGNAPAVF